MKKLSESNQVVKVHAIEKYQPKDFDDKFYVLIMDLLGHSLDTSFSYKKKQLIIPKQL